MKTSDFEISISEKMLTACRACIPLIKEELVQESIYAFTIFCDSGFTHMGIAVSTRESVARKINSNVDVGVPDNVFLMNASEWDYLAIHNELFEEVGVLIDEFYDRYYDQDFDDAQFLGKGSDFIDQFACDLFMRIIVDVIKHLKAASDLSDSPFESDLLLGIQFTDPEMDELDYIKSVSHEVNSRSWHDQVENNYKYFEDLTATREARGHF
ncbi:DUF4303 domain-containing protein [Undibacterium sp.]|uniref:DUF4303 domain-containing protein n=1 Tax=Undibacterium sp. TaxID=1914977 RepID=UPI00272F8FA8|nr:DUF4303 domain-containing protein [Undibacterium sp.]MDP1979218.1 DUF4303 domain-containing protein [Undibacterium sp.]